jgi:hypothetical protein
MQVEPTLTQFNRLLKDANLPHCIVDQAQYEKVKTDSALARVVSALCKAKDNDDGARTYAELALQKYIRSPNCDPHPSSRPPMTPNVDHGNVTQNPKQYISHHVYGKSSALEFSGKLSKKQDFATVFIDAAEVIADTKKINWQDKITVQITASELPVVAAVLCGYVNGCAFSNHGPSKDKGFEIVRNHQKNQPHRYPYVVKVFQKGNAMRVVPMTSADTFYVLQIVLSQLKKNLPHQDTALLITGLQCMGATLKGDAKTVSI